MSTEITPDTKDWTWVVNRRCPECGFDPDAVTTDILASRILDVAAGWRPRLAREDARTRPQQDVWSPVEYAAHLRDAATVLRERLDLILGQDDPVFPNWDQDAAALAADYANGDPATLVPELEDAVASLSLGYRQVGPQDWDRTGRRGDGAVFTAWTLGLYALHELEHHAHDVR